MIFFQLFKLYQNEVTVMGQGVPRLDSRGPYGLLVVPGRGQVVLGQSQLSSILQVREGGSQSD